MIYLLNTTVVIPGKMAERSEVVIKEMAPLFPKLGMKQVASWHAYTGNMNETFSLYEFKDLAEYQKVVETRSKNPDYQRVNAKLNALQVSVRNIILEPNTWSPLK
jgi:hypothetical protein